MTIKTRNIGDSQVTLAKLAAGAIDTATQLLAGSIAEEKLSDANFELNFTTGLLADGLGALRHARCKYDVSGGDSGAVAAHTLGVTLPAKAIVVGGYMDVVTVFTSTGGNGTIAISVEGANAIQTAASIAGAPWSTTGRKAIVPKFNTPETTGVKTSVARLVTATVGTNAILTGKVYIHLFYVVSI